MPSLFLLLLSLLPPPSQAPNPVKLTIVIDPAPEDTYFELESMVLRLYDDVFPKELGGFSVLNISEAVVKAREPDTPEIEDQGRQNPLSATRRKVCNEIINNTMVVVLVHPPSPSKRNKFKDMVSAISYALGFYEVPVISVASRQTEFSDKSIYPTFLRSTEPFSNQAEVWIALLQKLEYRKVIVIRTEDDNSNAMISRFREMADKLKIEIQQSIELESGLSSAAEQLIRGLDETTSNIYLLHANAKDAEVVFRDAATLNMTQRGKAWIVTESCLDAKNVPQGTIGVKLELTREQAVQDAFVTIRKAFAKLYQWSKAENVEIAPPEECATKMIGQKYKANWTTIVGEKFYEYLRSVYFVDEIKQTAIWYDENGDRLGVPYAIMNMQLQPNDTSQELYQVKVGSFHLDERYETKMALELYNSTRIIWPGNSKEMPSEITLPTHLRVVTVNDPPFVFRSDAMESPDECATLEVLLQVMQPDISGYMGTKFLPTDNRGGALRDSQKTIEERMRATQNPYLIRKTKEHMNKDYKTRVNDVEFDRIIYQMADNEIKDEVEREIFKREYKTYKAEVAKLLLKKNKPVDGILIHGPWLPCSYQNASVSKQFCCSGYAVDLLVRLRDQVSQKIPGQLTFEIALVDSYGAPTKHPRTGETSWSGIIGMLENDHADVGIGALTINADREEVIDFSNPWHYHGITIMETKKARFSPMESFVQPFHWSLWVTIVASVLVVGCTLYILDIKSPFKRFYGQQLSEGSEFLDPGAYDEDEPLSFSGAMWFVWGVLLDSGIGEKTPRCLSARVVGMVWCGFSMIMVASYTANLAAFLVLDQPTKTISGITDTRLRNPSANFTFATVADSNVYMYFKKHVELSTMFRKMEGRNYVSSAQAIDALKRGTLDAFIWDSTRLEYEAAKDCQLITSAGKFGRAAYGIGLQKDSPWTRIFTLGILQLGENGQMEDLDAKWISRVRPEQMCPETDDAPVRLGLINMKDAFFLVAIGILVGMVLSCVEVHWKRRKIRELHRKQIALEAGRHWRERTAQRGPRDGDVPRALPPSPESQALLTHSKAPALSRVAQKIKHSSASASPLKNDIGTPAAQNSQNNDLSEQRKASAEFGFRDFKSGTPLTKAVRQRAHWANAKEKSARPEAHV